MIRLLLTAPASNTGKTSVTCGLLALLARKGYNPCCFKCGPDYIDPMFHRSVLNVESHNLDLFLAGKDNLVNMFKRYSAGHEAVVCEGVMGYYDGLGMSSEASSWQVSEVLDIPSILVVRPKGSSVSLAAVINGMKNFRPNKIGAVILNDCNKMLYMSMKDMLEKETGLPVLGYLPHMEEAVFESRHLGLYTAAEITDLRARIEVIADAMEESIDFDCLLKVCGIETVDVACGNAVEVDISTNENTVVEAGDVCTADFTEKSADAPVVAVAKDDAFCFIYRESLDAMTDAGAKLVYFSPLEDEGVPDEADAMYLPGGYPELYAEKLSANTAMLQSVKAAIESGLPTLAECGGFLYIGTELEDGEGKMWPMVGALPGISTKKERLVRFGYALLETQKDSMLFKKGEEVPIHEFHYWDTTANGEDLHAKKPYGKRNWECAFTSDTFYAGFPHIYLAGEQGLGTRFVEAARKHRLR